MTNQFQVLTGADPEYFIKSKGCETFSSAHGVIPGTKADPYKVNKGAVQVDGMALEFNIDPAATEAEFIENITTVMNTLKNMLPDHEHVLSPVADFTPEVMAAQPEEALDLGCDPDYDAYTGQERPRPDATGITFRTAAGHVHIGWTQDTSTQDPDHKEACQMLAQQLDYYLGLGSMLIDPEYRRRALYGKAGSFRVKPYGMEYRTLSNVWLKDEKLMGWVYRMANKAFTDLAEGKSMFNLYGNFAQGCINRDCESSENLIKIIKRTLKKLDIEDPTEL